MNFEVHTKTTPAVSAKTVQSRVIIAAEWLLIALFVGVISLPTLDELCHTDLSPVPGENRLLAPAPNLNRFDLASIRGYPSAFESYYNDHFGYRKWLIRRFQQWKFRLFRDQSGYKVITGKDHWLYTSEEQTVDHFLGLARFTPRQLQTWATVLDKRTDWLAAHGIQYVFVVPPDKQDIYPEHLPDWLLQAAPAQRETKFDQLLNYLHGHSHATVLDLRPVLLTAKADGPVYLQNDTHWNLPGAFLGCQALLQTLAIQQPGLTPLDPAAFQWTNTPVPGGDMTRILGVSTLDPNHFDLLSCPTSAGLQTNETSHFQTAWGLKVLYIVDNPAVNGPNIVMFHDSFADPWRHLLSYRFHRVAAEWSAQDFNRSLILSNHPAVVVSEILERTFNVQDPQEILEKDGLP